MQHRDQRLVTRQPRLWTGPVIGPGEYSRNEPQYCNSKKPPGIADYVTAAIDPADEDTAWLIANFLDQSDGPNENDAIRAIVARVTL